MARLAYIVQEVCWEYNDEWHTPKGSEPYKVYLSRERAEAARQSLELEARASLLRGGLFTSAETGNFTASPNPLDFLEDFTALTDKTEEVFEAQARSLGLPALPRRRITIPSVRPEKRLFSCLFRSTNPVLPERVLIDLYENEWWESAWAILGPERAGELWELLEKVRFYMVAEVELDTEPALG